MASFHKGLNKASRGDFGIETTRAATDNAYFGFGLTIPLSPQGTTSAIKLVLSEDVGDEI